MVYHAIFFHVKDVSQILMIHFDHKNVSLYVNNYFQKLCFYQGIEVEQIGGTLRNSEIMQEKKVVNHGWNSLIIKVTSPYKVWFQNDIIIDSLKIRFRGANYRDITKLSISNLYFSLLTFNSTALT